MEIRSMREFVYRWLACREQFDRALSSGACEPFLPLLALPYQKLMHELYPLMIENGFTDEDYGQIPFAGIAVMGLESQSSYWVELAVRWLEDGLPVTTRISSAIYRLVKSAQTTENIRQRAQKFAG